MMMPTLVLKVLCGRCGAKIGEVYAGDAGLIFRPVWPTMPRNERGEAIARSSRADSIGSGQFWCLDHGFIEGTEVEKAASAALEAGKVGTLRARPKLLPR